MPLPVRLAALAFLAAVPAAGAEIDLASRIERVTVFPDAALVTRTAAISLPAGASTLVLRGLPFVADAGSVRVEGEGAFAIGAVDLRVVPGEVRPAVDTDLERRIAALREERERVAARTLAANGRNAAIERFAGAGPERLGPEGRPLEVAQWAAAWDAIGAGLAAVAEELRVLTAAARDLDAQITVLERGRPAAPRPGAPRRDVAVAVDAPAGGSATVRVSYRVTAAAWTAAYDARLDTGAKDRPPTIDLARRAMVQQRTGEDWSDVALTVSTARVARGTAAPDLAPLQIDFAAPPMAMAARPASRSLDVASAPVPAPPAEAREAEAARQKAVEVEAAVESSPFQVAYAVPGRVAVAGDGTPRALLLARATAKPSLAVTTTPVLDETAYLTAAFTLEDGAPLPAGEVLLNRDGTFVGRARLRATAPGETIELGFGADEAVRVTRVPVRRRENDPSLPWSTKTDLREFKTSVRNLHAGPIRITLLDRVPFSENTAIVVDLLKETTTPSERAPGDRRGVLSWSADYAPGETRDVRLVYRLKWPADRDVTMTPRPVGPGPRS